MHFYEKLLNFFVNIWFRNFFFFNFLKLYTCRSEIILVLYHMKNIIIRSYSFNIHNTLIYLIVRREYKNINLQDKYSR